MFGPSRSSILVYRSTYPSQEELDNWPTMSPELRAWLDDCREAIKGTPVEPYRLSAEPKVKDEATLAFEAELKAAQRIRLDNLKKKPKKGRPPGTVWDQRICRWVPDPRLSLPVRPVDGSRPGVNKSGSGVDGVSPVVAPKPAKGDDIKARLTEYEPAALREFAERNGVWNDKYLELPNPGLIRMNIGNRLRAKIKRGEAVEW